MTPSEPRHYWGWRSPHETRVTTPCPWPDFPIPHSRPTWPESSRQGCGRRFASRSRTHGWRRGWSSATSSASSRRARSPTTSCSIPRPRIIWRPSLRSGPKLGLAWVELSTGRFSLTGLMRTELADEIARLNPSEILISELSLDAPWARLLRGQSVALDHAAVLGLSARASAEDAVRALPHDDACRFRHRRSGDRSAGRRCSHGLSADTQKSSLGHIARLIPYRRADTLALDEMTRRSLELVRTLREGKREGSLLSVIDLSSTPMGSRQLSEWLTSPLTSTDLIVERLEAVDELVQNSALRGRHSEACSAQSYDLERLAARVGHRPCDPARPGGPRQDAGDPSQAQGAV